MEGARHTCCSYLLRPRRAAPPLESFYKFMNLNPEPSMTLGFAPYSLRGVASKDTDFPNRFQAGIIKKKYFFEIFFSDLKTIFFSSFHTSDFFIFIAFLDFITKKVRNKKK